jgi:hypothetical protein
MRAGWGAPGPIARARSLTPPRRRLRAALAPQFRPGLALLLLVAGLLSQRCQGVGTAAAAGERPYRRHHRHHPQLLRGADGKEAAWLAHCVDVSTYLMNAWPGRSIGRHVPGAGAGFSGGGS